MSAWVREKTCKERENDSITCISIIIIIIFNKCVRAWIHTFADNLLVWGEKKEDKEGQVSVWERNREREWECEGMEEKEREGIMKSGERERLFIFIVH